MFDSAMSAGHQCCLRSLESVERNSIKRQGKDNIPTYQCNTVGIGCTKCGKAACIDCLWEFIHTVPEIFLVTDPWCAAVYKYLYEGLYPPDFIGHCCELKETWRKLKLEPPPKETRYDGHLYLPEFSILIDSPFNCVDVHGLGGSKKLQAVWHCVLSHKAAEAMYSNNVNIPCFTDVDQRIVDVVILSPYADVTIKVRLPAIILFRQI